MRLLAVLLLALVASTNADGHGHDHEHVKTMNFTITDGDMTIKGVMMHDEEDDSARPAVLLIGPMGDISDFVAHEGEEMVEMGYSVAAVDLKSAMPMDFDALSAGRSSADDYAAYIKKVTMYMGACTDCGGFSTKVNKTKIAVVGWGKGGNGALAAAYYNDDIMAAVAYTPDIASGMYAPFSSAVTTGVNLMVVVDYDQLDHLQSFEAALNSASVMWEIQMIGGTKMHFNVEGNDNYLMEPARRVMVQSASFISETFAGGAKGTMEPERNIATLTEMSVEYMDANTTLPGLLVYDSAVATSTNKQGAVVVVPAWSGYSTHEVLRQNQFASMGYVTMSANIYGAPIETTFSGDERLGYVGQWRNGNLDTAGKDEQAKNFTQRIEAAVMAVKDQPMVDGDKITILGFCFGGTGVYNYFRYEGESQVAVSMHGNMMKTRDFSDVPSTTKLHGYLLMISGGSDNGESETALEEHLKEISMYTTNWEVIRFSGVPHGFSEWDGDRYDMRAEGRGFRAMMDVMENSFGGKPMAGSASALSANLFATLAVVFVGLFAAIRK